MGPGCGQDPGGSMGTTANSSFVDFAVVPGAMDGKCLGHKGTKRYLIMIHPCAVIIFFFIELIQ